MNCQIYSMRPKALCKQEIELNTRPDRDRLAGSIVVAEVVLVVGVAWALSVH